MQAAGLHVWTDAIGNLRGVLDGAAADTPRLLIGSHLDTVIDAGPFDGPLGVTMGIALADAIRKEGDLPYALEVIGFSEEEGVRFAKPFLGSLAVIGELNDATLALKDGSGVAVTQAVHEFGLDPANLQNAVIGARVFGYLEFHIEQGPVLDDAGASLGFVEAIAGQTRMLVTFCGKANHAGTTPMGRLRHDAVAAAGEWISDVERYANARQGLVATVGKVEVPGGAGNVIAGTCVATLDVRHANDKIRKTAGQRLVEAAERAGLSRQVAVEHRIMLEQDAVAMDSGLTKAISDACERAAGRPPRRMVSGAGHDAMILARRVPAAMVFLRSPEGLSHHPDESIRVEDVEAAFRAGMEFLRRLRDDRAMLSRLVARSRKYRREGRDV